MLNKIKTKIRNAKNRFLKSKFLVFTLGLIIGGTYTFIYLTAPILFKPCIRTIEIHNASAETPKREVKKYPVEKKDIKSLVIKYFGKDAPTALKILKCESGSNPACGELNNPKCINTKNGSYDRGYWQISKKYHPEVSDKCAFNPECATKEAYRIFEERGWGEWACSRYIR